MATGGQLVPPGPVPVRGVTCREAEIALPLLCLSALQHEGYRTSMERGT
jgi:hypothetical protein